MMTLSILLLLIALKPAEPVVETHDPPVLAMQLRARAVLALVFSEPVPMTDRYEIQYQRAIREQKPLLVWIGQPSRNLPGCLSCSQLNFPGVTGPAVVVGIPSSAGNLQRIDLPGIPSDERIDAVLPWPWRQKQAYSGDRVPAMQKSEAGWSGESR
jgi:hypothetical protein